MIDLPQEIENKYEVLSKMGEGGMGSVYKVRHRLLDEIQVIKLLQSRFQTNPELKSRFLREAKTAKQLRHPNIAEVIDYSVAADGTAFIVMGFIQGVNLREVQARKKGALNFQFVVDVGVQSLAAIGYLHKKGYVHRDISSDNLMLTKDEDGQPLIKLIDLGIAKSMQGTANLTMAGRFLGKVHYASPEQFGAADGSSKIDNRSDLYSLGVVLYELLTGQFPVTGSDHLAIITGKLTRPPRTFDETDTNGRVPLRLRDIVMKSLKREPAERFQTAKEFAHALESVIEVNVGPTQKVYFPLDDALDLDSLSAESSPAEREDWDAAARVDSVTSWEEYLARHASSARAERARERLEELESIEETDWNRAAEVENIELWREYLGKHGNSSRASKGRRRLEKLEAQESERSAWEAAVGADSVTGWQSYVRQHPRSTRAGEAEAKLIEARERAAEQEAWRAASEADSPAAWREYIEKHGRSTRADEARARLTAVEEREQEEHDWDNACQVAAIAAWREFIARHPDSPHVAEANRELEAAVFREAEERDWQRAVSSATSAAWRNYLDRYKSSPRFSKAKEQLARAERLEQERRDFDRAAAENSAKGWRAFVASHGASERIDEAKQRLRAAEAAEQEQRDWTRALSNDTTAIWREYVSAHGDGPRIEDARHRLADAERRDAENRAWETAVAEDTADRWREFTARHASSPRLKDAKSRLKAAEKREVEDRDWNDSQRADDVAGWKAFLAKHASSPRATEAVRRLADSERREAEQLEWEQAKARDTSKGLRDFTAKYPKSQHTAEAKRRLQEAEEREARRQAELREQAQAAEQARQRASGETRRDTSERSHSAATLVGAEAEATLVTPLPPIDLSAERTIHVMVPPSTDGDVTVIQFVPPAATIGTRPGVPTLAEAPPAARTRAATEPALPERPRLARPIAISAAVVVTIVIIVAASKIMRHPGVETVTDTTSTATTTGTAGATITVTATTTATATATTTTISSLPTPPPRLTGQLVVNALPWGEVESIRDASNKEYVSQRPAYTPIVLSLPAGEYRLTVTNPNTKRRKTVPATVKANGSTKAEVQLGLVDAEEYLRRQGITH